MAEKPLDARILRILKTRPDATMAELAKELKKSTPTMYRHVGALVQEGRLKRVGSRKTGRWEVL